MEKRKHKRYQAKEGYFAGAYPNVGQIINISMGGLAYNYMGHVKEEVDEGEMVICGDDCSCLDDLSCRVIEDTVIANETSFSKFVTRQRRIQFVNLTPEQQVLLENFINNHRDEIRAC